MSTACRTPGFRLLALALLVSGCNAKTSENTAETNATEPVSTAPVASAIPDWVTSEAGPSLKCALSKLEEKSDNPFFAFNGTTDAPDFHCRVTGPFDWDGKQWFVFRIHSLTTSDKNPGCAMAGVTAPCLFDGTRVCSRQAQEDDPTPVAIGAGPIGCAVLQPPKFRKKP